MKHNIAFSNYQPTFYSYAIHAIPHENDSITLPSQQQ